MIPKEFLGAFKAGHRASSREFIDEEFALRLLNKVLREDCDESRKLLGYLTKFNNEFHKNVIKKGDPESLHHTETLRKSCYARENAKNSDISSVRKSQLIYVGHQVNFAEFNYTEDEVIEALDQKRLESEYLDLILNY